MASALLPDQTTLGRAVVLETPSKQCPVCEMALPATGTEDPLAEDDRTIMVRRKEPEGNGTGELGAGESPTTGIAGASGPRRRAINATGKDTLGARLPVGAGRSRTEFKEKIMAACARAAAGKEAAPIAGTMCSRTNTSEARVRDVVVYARA